MIGVIDYKVGNVGNLLNALHFLNLPAKFSSDPDDLQQAERLILPGVGAFTTAMEQLWRTGLDQFIHMRAQQSTPILGICLGMQLLFDRSSENGDWPGLGLIPGEVRRFTGVAKIPHMGWNQVVPRRSSPLFDQIAAGSFFYFVHSYYCQPQVAGHVLATADYAGEFTAAVQCGSLFGVQFHPEKSQQVGLQLLKNFAELPLTGKNQEEH